MAENTNSIDQKLFFLGFGILFMMLADMNYMFDIKEDIRKQWQ